MLIPKSKNKLKNINILCCNLKMNKHFKDYLKKLICGGKRERDLRKNSNINLNIIVSKEDRAINK